MPTEQAEHPLRPIVSQWMRKWNLSREWKDKHFDDFAEQGMAFYVGDDDARPVWSRYMLGQKGAWKTNDPELQLQFKFVMAKVAETVQIFGPMLYHRNPQRRVKPRQLPRLNPEAFGNPQDQRIQQFVQGYQQRVMQREAQSDARAELMEAYLNFTPNELDLKTHSRRAINEALIKGAGVLWTETYQPYDGAHTLVGSFHDTIDNLFIDPDAETLEDALWIDRIAWLPVWQVAQDYGVDEEELRDQAADIQSLNSQAENGAGDDDGDGDYDEDRPGKTNDLVKVHKIYSKMGMGDLLSGVPEDLKGTLQAFGENVYLVVVKGVPYPLNLPSELLLRASEGDGEAFDEAFQKVQWPIPFWLDGEWPCSMLYFHEIPNQVWPMSHIRPGLPELKFLNFGMSFLAENARHTSRLYAGVRESAEDENKRKLEDGPGFTVVPFKRNESGSIGDLFQFATPPNGTSRDLWEVMSAVQEQFDKRTGLSETMYAMPGGMRSATEAQVKQETMNIRPDDMGNRVEDWMSRVSRKEALAAQWLLDPEDVQPVFGPDGAMLWERFIMSADARELIFEFDYRIEAGSARKPNKATQQENLTQFGQTILPEVMQWAQQFGDVGPVNTYLKLWSNAHDFDEGEQFTLQPPPPPQPDPVEQAQQQFEMQKMQFELAKLEKEMQGKQVDAQLEQQMAQMKMQMEQMKMAQDRQKHEQEMRQQQQEHRQEMRQQEREHEQEMEHQEEENQLKLAIEKKLAEAKRKEQQTPSSGSKT